MTESTDQLPSMQRLEDAIRDLGERDSSERCRFDRLTDLVSELALRDSAGAR